MFNIRSVFGIFALMVSFGCTASDIDQGEAVASNHATLCKDGLSLLGQRCVPYGTELRQVLSIAVPDGYVGGISIDHIVTVNECEYLDLDWGRLENGKASVILFVAKDDAKCMVTRNPRRVRFELTLSVCDSKEAQCVTD